MRAIPDLLLPLASAVMVACITVSLIAVSYTFGSTWHSDYLVPLSALVAVESYFSARIRGYGRMRIIELGVIYAVLEAADTLSNGGTLRAALTPHVDLSDLLGAVLLLFVWLGVREMAEMLPEIHKSLEPSGIVSALALRFVAGGVLLFVTAGFSQRSLAGLTQLPVRAASGPLVNVLIYFLLGMLILSYVQYQSMQQRWEIQEVRIIGDLQGSWLRLTAALLVLALVVAVVLPTTQVFGLGSLVGSIWQLLVGFGTGIWNHLPGQGSAPPLSRVFGHGHHHHVPTPVGPPKSSHGPAAPSWLSAARTAVFWVVLAAGVLYMLFRVRWGAVADARPKRKRLSLLARFVRLWRGLWRRARRSARAVAALVPRGLPRRERTAPAGLRRFFRLNALSPEEQVRYFYLSLLRRAQQGGVTRAASQTPSEFSATLAPRVGDAEPDLEAVTDAFIEARYSGHSMEPEQVSPIKSHWQRVRTALRGHGVPAGKTDHPS
jgi:hypothetical protein